MAILDRFMADCLFRGRAYFTREDALKALGLSAESFSAAATRLIKKQRLASPRQGFYLIRRAEDRKSGVPEPARWIDPMMKYLGIDYRIALLRAASFHGSSHQAAMVFQVIAPRQQRNFVIGAHRLEFVYQSPQAFTQTNRADWLSVLKTEAGYAKVAGIELTLLDATRYFHKALGMNGVAQVVKDLGGEANPRKLAMAALHYENSTVRRLGYLLDFNKHTRQAKSLEGFALQAKSMKELDPSVFSIEELSQVPFEKDAKWKLVINSPV